MTIRVYTAKHCIPCEEVKELIEKGRVNMEVEVVDIETEEGFQKFIQEVLEFGDGVVPSAYKEGKKCLIRIDEEERKVLIECPTDDSPSSDEG